MAFGGGVDSTSSRGGPLLGERKTGRPDRMGGGGWSWLALTSVVSSAGITALGNGNGKAGLAALGVAPPSFQSSSSSRGVIGGAGKWPKLTLGGGGGGGAWRAESPPSFTAPSTSCGRMSLGNGGSLGPRGGPAFNGGTGGTRSCAFWGTAKNIFVRGGGACGGLGPAPGRLGGGAGTRPPSTRCVPMGNGGSSGSVRP